MKILVTGATGFLGKHLCDRLAAAGQELVRLGSSECDLTDATSLNRFTTTRYDQIMHLAAWTQAGDFCLTHPGEQWVINQQINTNVLAWWQRHQPQAKLISIGTSCSYAPEEPLTEDRYLTGTPIESLYTYAMTKRMLYVGLKSLHQQFGLNYLVVVPSTLYGPGYHMDGRQMHFIFDLIRKIIRGKLLGEPVVLWGDGHQKRELVYVDDFVSTLIALTERCDNDIVNIGAGEEHSIRDFARLICRQVGYDFNAILFDESRYVGARSKILSIDKLRRILPGVSMVPLETGLRNTIEWFQREYASHLSPR